MVRTTMGLPGSGAGAGGGAAGDEGCWNVMVARRRPAPDLFQITPRVHVERELCQRAYRDTRGAFGLMRLCILGPRSASDVHMDPRHVAHKLLDEERRRDGAAWPPARIGEVG